MSSIFVADDHNGESPSSILKYVGWVVTGDSPMVMVYSKRVMAKDHKQVGSSGSDRFRHHGSLVCYGYEEEERTNSQQSYVLVVKGFSVRLRRRPRTWTTQPRRTSNDTKVGHFLVLFRTGGWFSIVTSQR